MEDALAAALTDATKAGKWDVVSQLARELEARRLALEAERGEELADALIYTAMAEIQRLLTAREIAR